MGFADGLIGVVKPKGCTSFKVVDTLRKILVDYTKDKRIKVGHGGTLDPFATGVLVIGIGNGTKLLHKHLAGKKEYIVIGKLGEERDTMDIDGKCIRTADFQHITLEKLNTALNKYKGNLLQTPPQFSAKKKDGVRAYTLARKGIPIELQPNKITIYEAECLQFNLPYFKLRCSVSAGTYIRKLVHDLALDLESAAFAEELERTKQDTFFIENCLTQDKWTPENIYAQLRKWNATHQKVVTEKKELKSMYFSNLNTINHYHKV